MSERRSTTYHAVQVGGIVLLLIVALLAWLAFCHAGPAPAPPHPVASVLPASPSPTATARPAPRPVAPTFVPSPGMPPGGDGKG